MGGTRITRMQQTSGGGVNRHEVIHSASKRASGVRLSSETDVYVNVEL